MMPDEDKDKEYFVIMTIQYSDGRSGTSTETFQGTMVLPADITEESRFWGAFDYFNSRRERYEGKDRIPSDHIVLFYRISLN
jgi:hypothetical protein